MILCGLMIACTLFSMIIVGKSIKRTEINYLCLMKTISVVDLLATTL